jgi:hypothetical protein
VQKRYGRNGGEPFSSYVSDVLVHRVTDWYRSKAEGHGDRRYGFDGKVVLSPMDDDADVDADVDFENLLSERRLAEWTAAAALVGLPLAEFVVVTLDRASAAIQAAGSRTESAARAARTGQT